MATRIIDVSELGKRVRRPWSDEDKARFVTETLEPRATVRSMARRHGLDASLLYRWRRRFLAERLTPMPSAGDGFVPVQLALPGPAVPSSTLPAGPIEVMTAAGHRVRIRLERALPKLSRKSDLAIAVRYALSRWQALGRYLDDGRLEIDNNAAERTLRGVAPGRKNWLFAAPTRAASVPPPSTA